jgi:uncharacterized lipoprotein
MSTSFLLTQRQYELLITSLENSSSTLVSNGDQFSINTAAELDNIIEKLNETDSACWNPATFE